MLLIIGMERETKRSSKKETRRNKDEILASMAIREQVVSKSSIEKVGTKERRWSRVQGDLSDEPECTRRSCEANQLLLHKVESSWHR